MWGTEGLPDLIKVYIPRQSRATNTPHHAQRTLPETETGCQKYVFVNIEI